MALTGGPPCVHGGIAGSCPYCGPVYIPTTTGGTSIGLGGWYPGGTSSPNLLPGDTTYKVTMTMDRQLQESLDLALSKLKDAGKKLEEANLMLHDLMKKEVEWQERIDTLTGERDTMQKALSEVGDSIDVMLKMVQSVLHGDAEWVGSPKN